MLIQSIINIITQRTSVMQINKGAISDIKKLLCNIIKTEDEPFHFPPAGRMACIFAIMKAGDRENKTVCLFLPLGLELQTDAGAG